MATLLTVQSYGQLTFGPQAGLTLANMYLADDDDTYSDDNQMLPGFHLGGAVNYAFTEMLSAELGILYNNKGFKSSVTEGDDEYNEKVTLQYIDIPITLRAKFPVSDNVGIFGLIGPQIGLALSGVYKADGTISGTSYEDEEDIEIGTNEDEDFMKPLDFALTVGAGVTVSGIRIGASYDLGLANLAVDTDGGTELKNRGIRITVGYMFGGAE